MVSSHPEQGWSLLCNGVVSFDDAGDLLPDGRMIAPQPRSPHDHHVPDLPPTASHDHHVPAA